MKSEIAGKRKLRHVTLVLGAVMLASPSLAVPTPIHAFDFDGDYIDSITGTVTITPEGGAIFGSLHTMGPQVPPGDNNHGLTLDDHGLSDAGIYSIEMYLRYDSIRSIADQHWIKLVDFKDATIPWGMYYEDMAFSTRFDTTPAEPGVESLIKMAHPGSMGPPAEYTNGVPVMHAGEWNHVTITRDATDEFACYVDGELVFSYTDSGDYGVFSEGDAVMRFLQNDLADDAGNYFNTAAGSIDFLNIYDEAISAADVRALATTVPEPATATLLAGVALLAGMWRRCR